MKRWETSDKRERVRWRAGYVIEWKDEGIVDSMIWRMSSGGRKSNMLIRNWGVDEKGRVGERLSVRGQREAEDTRRGKEGNEGEERIGERRRECEKNWDDGI